VVDGLVAAGALVSSRSEQEPSRLLQLRVRGRDLRVEYAPLDEYRAAGD